MKMRMVNMFFHVIVQLMYKRASRTDSTRAVSLARSPCAPKVSSCGHTGEIQAPVGGTEPAVNAPHLLETQSAQVRRLRTGTGHGNGSY